MGFLDKLLNNAAKKAISDAIDSVTGNTSNTSNSSVPVSQPQAAPSPIPQETAFEDERTIEQKLDAILPAEFPSYQVQKNVDPRSMGAVGKSLIPFDYVISQNGSIKLVIMTPGNNTCSTRGYRFTKEFAVQSNITLINFLQKSLNEESYIIGRLHQYL